MLNTTIPNWFLNRFSKPNSPIPEIENCMVRSHEDSSQNPAFDYPNFQSK